MTCQNGCPKPAYVRHMCVACYAKRQRFGLFRRKPRPPCTACGRAYVARNFAHGLCGTCRKRVWRAGL